MLNSHQKNTPKRQIFWALVLILILSFGINFSFINTATAEANNLPDAVAKAVLQDASKRSSLAVEKLRIADSVKRDWSDGCLGLAEAGTLCTQKIVSGWQVKVVSGQKTLIYRTNSSGSLVKLEN